MVEKGIKLSNQSLQQVVVWCVLAFSLVMGMPTIPFASTEGVVETILDADEYFPNEPGNEWRYRGRIMEGAVEQIADETFMNTAVVKGEELIDGVALTTFHDTNPGNQGQSDSYYRLDAAGIVYYGSKPGTVLERQLVPYQVVRFPIQIPSSFEQLDRKDLDLGLDLDRDGETERVDVQASLQIVKKEPVSVPLRTYAEAIRLEARMTMRVYLSGINQVVQGSDTMMAWFVKGVGLVKYIERQSVPMLGSGKDRLIEISEELEGLKIEANMTSLHRGKSAAKRVFTDHTFHHKLLQVPFPSRFLAYPR